MTDKKKSPEQLAARIIKVAVEDYLNRSGVYKELEGYDISIHISVSSEEKFLNNL